MKRLLQLITAGVLFLFVGLSIMNAQGASYSPGPAVTPLSGAANGGFAWADLNGDGVLDVWIPSNNILLSTGSTFTSSSTMAANITLNTNSVGGALADFNGDGVPDLMTTNGGTVSAGLYYNIAGVLTAATGTGALATAPNFGTTNGQVFMGLAVGPIDHSNYLSIVYTPAKAAYSDGLLFARGYGIALLKGGASGFTNVGINATAANLAIDTSLSYEAWDPRFLDATNDGWMDLMVPSFRHGFARIDTVANGAGKGCVQFVNNGAGKFFVPTATTLGRTIYSLDTAGTWVTRTRRNWNDTADSSYWFDSLYTIATTKVDTGIIVDDTVRHFGAIGCQFGDLNNDGNMDLILTNTGADNWNGLGSYVNTAVIYGKGDGTYTYHWSGTTTVVNGLTNQGGTRAWGVGDYNNDGWQDLFTCTNGGSVFMYQNNGNGTFTDVTTLAAVTTPGQRAAGFVDYNNDGFPDIYLYTGGNSILQKNNGNTNKWIGFTPVGTGNNKMAIGARFTVWSGATKQIRDIRASGGAAGQADVRALFGLGTGNVDSIMVQWPDGTTQKWTGTELSANGGTTVTNKYWTIQQGAIIPAAIVKVGPSWAAGDTSLTPYDTLKWNSTAGGTGTVTYQAHVATASSFATVLKNITGLTATNTIVRLGLSTKYYWRVRAISAGFTGIWSSVDSFRTKVVACTTVPTKLAPASNLLTVPVKPVLKVSYVPEASTYHIQVAGSDTAFVKNGAFVLNDSVNVLDTAYTMAAQTPGKKYFWRVRGWNPAGNSSWSTVDSFTIMYLPATPVLAYPTSNLANVRADTLVLKWRKVAGDSNYVVQLWTYTSGGQTFRSDTTKKDTTFKVTSLMTRSRYYWKVLAFNQGGTGTFTALDSFTTAIEVPPAVVTISPKGLTGVNRRTYFTWRPALNAASYHLQVASTNFPTTNIVFDKMLLDTSILIADTLLANSTYYWHVSGINAGGEGPYSAAAFFATGTTVGVDGIESTIPTEFALMQNFPNPFNPSTTILYDIPTSAFVNVTIYDVLGREVATLVNEVQSANHYRIQWNASDISSGMYILRIRANSLDGSKDFTSVKKLLFMK